MAAAHENRGDRLRQSGLAGIAPEKGVLALERLLRTGAIHAGVLDLDVAAWRRTQGHARTQPLFDLLAAAGDKGAASSASLALVVEQAVPGQRLGVLESLLRQTVAEVLGKDSGRIDVNVALPDLGLDSLLSVELRNRLTAGFGVDLPLTVVWRHPTIAALTPYVAEKMRLVLTTTSEASPAAVEAKGEQAAKAAVAAVAQLSDAEVEAQMLEALAALEKEMGG
jgi:acyl carrier protein